MAALIMFGVLATIFLCALRAIVFAVREIVRLKRLEGWAKSAGVYAVVERLADEQEGGQS